MDFLYPEHLLLLVFLIPISAFLVWRGHLRMKAIRQLGDPELIAQLLTHVHWRNRRLKQLLWLGTLACLFFALARPISGVVVDYVDIQHQQVVFLVDVSLSMDATDMMPSRLDVAKLDMLMLAQSVPAEFAIVLFAADAFPYMPFTDDTFITSSFIESISTSSTTQQGSLIVDALRYATTLFSPDPLNRPFIILFSDGENHEGDARFAIDALARQQIAVYAMGYGTPTGSLIPLYDNTGALTYKTDANNILVETRLDEAFLRQITDATNGIYFNRSSGGDLPSLLPSNAMMPSRQRAFTRPNELFPLFVLAALFLLSSLWLLPESRTSARGDL